MDFEFIQIERDDPVAMITLNRPEVLNAWHKPMRNELMQALRTCEADDGIGAIVLTGAGERAFSAGQDLNEAKDFSPDRAHEWIEEWRSLYSLLRGLKTPSVAALNGVAAGSAFQFVMLLDVRVGHAGVRMGQPEMKSGIVSVLGPWIMREMFGLSRTVEMALTGRLLNADEAYRAGIIHRLVEPSEVLATAQEVARELAAMPPLAMRLTKAWLAEMTQADFDRAIEAAHKYHEQAYASGEPQRWSARFVSKRRQ